MKESIEQRIGAVAWNEVAKALTDEGFSRLPRILSPEESQELAGLYEQEERFRSHIDMARYRFGRGEYRYFRYPLPPLVAQIRHRLYPRLAGVANDWAGMLGSPEVFPSSLEELLERCHRRGQTRPTPLLLRYRTGDYNCLHQDIYGEIAFPFQVVLFLSRPGIDYTGGEFLLTEQVPRAQTMGRALLPDQGDGLIITTRYRPAQGKRGAYRVTVRHGVSPVLSGERRTLGIIFHDAE